MTQTEIVLLVLLFVSLCVAAIFFVLYLRNRSGQEKLSDSINDYIGKGTVTQFSTRDSSIARLQNCISDLEALMTLEHGNTAAQSRRNADFIADISHQLKTPLAGLRLYCEMEQESAPTAHTGKELQLIEKMETLIYSLLRLEKLRSDSYTMDFQSTELESMINSLVNEFRHLFPQKKYIINGNACMRCDKTWLSEAISNTVKNASEHTKADGTIGIRIENGESSVLITVEDDGGGVPEEQLPLIFGRFFRTGDAVPESTGIGLAITRAIVEKHHGTVSAENGKLGLRITMCFPLFDCNLKIE